MKILYLHQYFAAREGNWITRTYEFARRLQAMGHEVTVVTSAGYLPDEYKALTKTTHLEIEGIPVIIIPVPYSNYMSFSRRIRAFVQFAFLASWVSIRTRADLVYATSTPLTIAIPGIIAGLWQRIPMIFEVRDLWPELPIAVGALRSPVVKVLARGMEWIAYHMARHVVALSPGMAEGVQRRGIPAERITVIPNSCDVDLFDVPPETGDPIRARLALAPGQPLVVYTGSFGLLNDVGYLVKVAAEMRSIAPDVRFLLMGTGAEYEKVSTLATESGVLGENLTIWKPVPKREMPAILAAATIATSLFQPMPEMWNNSANKFFDGLAAGRPMAINYGGWQAELLERTGAGIRMEAENPRKAAEQLAAFARDEARLAQARVASRDLAYHEFNRDLMAAKMEQIMRQVVAG